MSYSTFSLSVLQVQCLVLEREERPVLSTDTIRGGHWAGQEEEEVLKLVRRGLIISLTVCELSL